MSLIFLHIPMVIDSLFVSLLSGKTFVGFGDSLSLGKYTTNKIVQTTTRPYTRKVYYELDKKTEVKNIGVENGDFCLD
jgi:hypothetical protein